MTKPLDFSGKLTRKDRRNSIVGTSSLGNPRRCSATRGRAAGEAAELVQCSRGKSRERSAQQRVHLKNAAGGSVRSPCIQFRGAWKMMGSFLTVPLGRTSFRPTLASLLLQSTLRMLTAVGCTARPSLRAKAAQHKVGSLSDKTKRLLKLAQSNFNVTKCHILPLGHYIEGFCL